MGYLGFQHYNPIGFHDFDKFTKYAQDIFKDYVGYRLEGYLATFNGDDFGTDAPIILQFENDNIEISTLEDEQISLTKNEINLNDSIIWLKSENWNWINNGIELLDSIVGTTMKSVSLVGLDYPGIGIAIHGILLEFITEKRTIEVLIRTNYDEISIMELKNDDVPEVKIIKTIANKT